MTTAVGGRLRKAQTAVDNVIHLNPGTGDGLACPALDNEARDRPRRLGFIGPTPRHHGEDRRSEED